MSNIYQQILDDYIQIKAKIIEPNTKHFPTLLNEYTRIKAEHTLLNQTTGHAYNYLYFFSIGETTHSYIIKEFLNEHGSHGQKRLFLDRFLEDVLKLDLSKPTEWHVTAETGRIDVCLKSDEGHVIIIENKSNNAVDQNNQLYRYWLQEVYYPLKDIHGNKLITSEFYMDTEEGKKIKLIYLPPDKIKKPNYISLCKPLMDDAIDLPDVLPIKFDLISFKKEIALWLENCLGLIPETNYRLKEFVKMYIEYSKNLNT